MSEETTERTESEETAGDDTGRTLAEARDRVTELEKALTGRESEIAELKQGRTSLETRVADLSRSLAEMVEGYRSLVVAANPGVPAELIGGDSLAAISESLNKAKALVQHVRQGLEADLRSARFPAGAPERGAPDLNLSPREKIQQGIAGPKR